MSPTTILFTSVGRRKYVFDTLREAARDRPDSFRFVAIDASWSAPGLAFADAGYVVPRVDEDGYLDALESVMATEEVDYVIPTNDLELLELAAKRDQLQSEATLLMPDEAGVRACADKFATRDLFEDLGLRTPRTVTIEEGLAGEIAFPVVVKGRGHKSTTRGFDLAESPSELAVLEDRYESPIVQEFVDGQEFTVDVLVDPETGPLSVVPRKRLALRESVSDKGVTVDNDDVIAPVRKIVERVGAHGFTNIQFIDTGDERYWLEINPRIAGGVALGLAASNIASQLLGMLAGDAVSEELRRYERGLYMAKYDGVRFVTESEGRDRVTDLTDTV
jgi:carbamoyl-phosphate synthase large subunit